MGCMQSVLELRRRARHGDGPMFYCVSAYGAWTSVRESGSWRIGAAFLFAADDARYILPLATYVCLSQVARAPQNNGHITRLDSARVLRLQTSFWLLLCRPELFYVLLYIRMFMADDTVVVSAGG